MHDKDTDADDGRSLVSNRTMEIVVALLLLAGSGIVLYDSLRLGAGWQEGIGPAAGYFPFWIALILGASSLVILATAIAGHGAGEVFVELRPGLGIYVASAIFMLGFMLVVGRESILKSIGVSILVPIALFFMFEKWFLVPLPKGPLELWLGY
jgi:putative tricarboxylic transport membrane protein